MDFLGMETPPATGGGQSLVDVMIARSRALKSNSNYSKLLQEYEEVVAAFTVEIEAHKLTKAALKAREDQIGFIVDKGVENATARVEKKYRNGDKKSVGRLFFEEAVKKHGQSLGLSLNKIIRYLDI